MLHYCQQLSACLSSLHSQVKAVLPEPKEEPLHDLKPGDWVVIKDFRRKHWNSPRWLGPFQVLLTTATAIKTEGRTTWVHTTHVRKVPEPQQVQGATTGNND
ncbi:hypothetical protein LDENG_00237790 [Lucifuga dentata]|nr:hypothetical protein LDENG_00237790 [Lucifuga dentata]